MEIEITSRDTVLTPTRGTLMEITKVKSCFARYYVNRSTK